MSKKEDLERYLARLEELGKLRLLTSVELVEAREAAQALDLCPDDYQNLVYAYVQFLVSKVIVLERTAKPK